MFGIFFCFMCIAIPMKVVELSGDATAVVEQDGIRRHVNIRLLPDCRIGDYLLIHAGYAIEIIDPEAAAANLQSLEEMKETLGL